MQGTETDARTGTDTRTGTSARTGAAVMAERRADKGADVGSVTVWRDGADVRGRHIASLSTLATVVVVCGILYAAKGLFLPLALGMLFAFILTPVVDFLRRRSLPDTPAVVLTVLAASALVGAFVLVFVFQIGQIGSKLPNYQGNVLKKIDTLLDMGKDSLMVSRLQEMVASISARLEREPADPVAGARAMKVEVVENDSLIDWLSGVIVPALTPVAIFGLIIVVVFFALLERAALRDRLVQLIGGNNIVATSRLLAEAGSRVSTYLASQVLVNVIYAVPIALGLWLIGVPNALFFGLVTLVLRFVPYIGSAISAILPLLMAFAASPDWWLVLLTGGLFLVVEFVTSNVIEPLFYGRRTGVSPLAVIVSAMFWTWLWGPMGLIMATPLTVCLVVIGHHVPSLRLFPIMLGDKPVLAEPAQIYDRLLAGHPFAFVEAAGPTSERSLSEYYASTAIPALVLAQADHEAGLLSDHQTTHIAHAAWRLTEDLDSIAEDELASTADTDSDEAGPRAAVGIGHRVAVIGSRTVLDDAVATMLAQAMRAAGASTLAMPHRANLSMAFQGFSPQTVVFTTLDAEAGPMLRRKVRHLRRLMPGTRIGVALWHNPNHGPERAAADPSITQADFSAYGMEAILTAVFKSSLAEAA